MRGFFFKLLKKNFFFFFWDGVSLCHPGWSALVRSQLTAALTSQAQVILMPQPPKQLGLQVHATTPGLFVQFLQRWVFCRDGFCRDHVAQAGLRFLGSSNPPTSASQNVGIRDYRCEQPHLPSEGKVFYYIFNAQNNVYLEQLECFQ